MGRRKTILVVEPTKAIRRRLRDALEPEGHEVLEAEDGWGAMWLVESLKKRIDLVITEAGTPLVAGPTFARRLERFGGKPRFLFVAGQGGSHPGGGAYPGSAPTVLLEEQGLG